MSDSRRAGDLFECVHCGKKNDLMTVDIEWKTLPNTLTDLPDRNTPIWRCKHCGCWQDED